jgi:hypothetical protein
VSKSRARLAPSLLAHHGPFDWGVGRCSRQPCQKQPAARKRDIDRSPSHLRNRVLHSESFAVSVQGPSQQKLTLGVRAWHPPHLH